MTEYKSITEVVKELVATQNKLAEVEKELAALKEKRAKRRKANPDSPYLAVLAIARRRIKGQEDTSALVIRKIILKAIIKKGYNTVDFFAKFDETIDRLKGCTPFMEECRSSCSGLTPDVVAQYVALQGEARVQKVFKSGLQVAMGDLLRHIHGEIFKAEEIQSWKKSQVPESEIKGLAE